MCYIYLRDILLNSGVCRSRVKAMPCNGVTMRLSTSVPAYLTKTFSGYFHTKLSNGDNLVERSVEKYSRHEWVTPPVHALQEVPGPCRHRAAGPPHLRLSPL